MIEYSRFHVDKSKKRKTLESSFFRFGENEFWMQPMSNYIPTHFYYRPH